MSTNLPVEPSRRFLLGLVGSSRVSDGVGEQFSFNGTAYYLVFECKIKVLLRDVSRLKEFTFELVPPQHNYLGLYFHPDRVETLQSNSLGLARQRLIQLFFTPANPPHVATDTATEAPTAPTEEYELLYERLRRRHLDNPRPATVDAQHKFLRPILRDYQRDGVNFMINRETVSDSIPAAFDVLQANAIADPSPLFYLNCYTGQLTDTLPDPVPLPSGGILADEMGLGKTVEMLSLILNHPRPPISPQSSLSPTLTIPPCITTIPTQIKCTCVSSSANDALIQCTKCHFHQHIKCVQKNRPATSTETPDNYICPKCWSQQPLVPTRATIIVSPYSISRQWQKEIETHIRDPRFQVLIYSGVAKFGWISPLDLAEYDVVITDYNVLKTEIHYTAVDSKEGCLRGAKKHLNPSSPLTALHWWRVCLDEAQMVETPTNQATRMVKTLPAQHRWAVTGTPIEKSINQLYGLLFFLDCVPYNEFPIWSRLAQPFLQHQNAEPLVEGVLKALMWRTCKRHVLDQIRIPPQTQRCHMVAMSDMQTVFYRDQHEQCRQAFLEQAAKMQRTGLASSMAKWDAHSLKLLLEPLRKLRQDCTMPSVVSKGEQLAKRLLSPDELYTHLLTVNEVECKSQLRAIASTLNGLAGIAMLLQEYPLAGRYYRSVLKRAEENQSGGITVDSLLQIHALHSLVQLLDQGREGVGDDDVADGYRERLRRLEAKYTDNYYQVMKSAENQLKSVQPTVNLKRHQDLVRWWRVVISEHSKSSATADQLVKKVNFEIRTNSFVNYNHNEDFLEVTGIDYTLTTWWDKVIEHRKKVHKGLNQLRYFTETIHPEYSPTAEERARVQRLIVAAAECHLIVEKEKEKAEGESDEEEEPFSKIPRKTAPCELCQVKLLLTEYECRIFDKSFNESRQEGEGTWKPSWQEWVTRTLRREAVLGGNEQVAKQAEEFAQLLETLKAEYKEMSKFWVEINYTTAAYDELNMCKLQLTAVDPEQLRKRKEKMKRHQISIHEIDLTRSELQAELDEAEMGFSRSMRNLSYLKHLAGNPEVQTCPVCGLKPEDKYSVWECGHQLCIQCLLAMKKYNGVKLSCPVCRHSQGFKDMHYVTVARQHNIHVEGRYSSKIVRIVQEVQALRKEDEKVKIIIFSQWEPNLAVIGNALAENRISTRSNKSLAMIEEFKSATIGVTCLLLPLKWGSKGLNLIEATHVFLVEPILNPSEELQAVGRVHRIGQTKATVVHRFIVENTVEETIYRTVANDATGKWRCKDISLDNLKELFTLNV